MNESSRQTWMWLEVILLIFPLCLFCILAIGYILLIVKDINSLFGLFSTVLGLVLIPLILGGTLTAGVIFARTGRSGLQPSRDKWKILIRIGISTIAVGWFILANDGSGTPDELLLISLVGIYSTPLLIPLLHLYFELRTRQTTDQTAA